MMEQPAGVITEFHVWVDDATDEGMALPLGTLLEVTAELSISSENVLDGIDYIQWWGFAAGASFFRSTILETGFRSLVWPLATSVCLIDAEKHFRSIGAHRELQILASWSTERLQAEIELGMERTWELQPRLYLRKETDDMLLERILNRPEIIEAYQASQLNCDSSHAEEALPENEPQADKLRSLDVCTSNSVELEDTWESFDANAEERSKLLDYIASIEEDLANCLHSNRASITSRTAKAIQSDAQDLLRDLSGMVLWSVASSQSTFEKLRKAIKYIKPPAELMKIDGSEVPVANANCVRLHMVNREAIIAHNQGLEPRLEPLFLFTAGSKKVLRQAEEEGRVEPLLKQIALWITGLLEELGISNPPTSSKLSLARQFSKTRGGSVLFYFQDQNDARALVQCGTQYFLQWDAAQKSFQLSAHSSTPGASADLASSQPLFRFTRVALARARKRILGKGHNIPGGGIGAPSFPQVGEVRDDVKAALPFHGHKVEHVSPEQYLAESQDDGKTLQEG